MKVYHATSEKFEKFDNKFIGQTDDGYFGKGFYFCDDYNDACTIRMHQQSSYIMTCKVSDNLYELDLSNEEEAINEFPASDDIKNQMREVMECNESFFKIGAGEGFGIEEILKDAGFDGIVIRNRFDSSYTEVVIFDEKDIEIIEIEENE